MGRTERKQERLNMLTGIERLPAGRQGWGMFLYYVARAGILSITLLENP
jgi:hypothetical protein